MAAEKCGQSRCGLCRFYRHEGRRVGTCSQLNVSVSADLDACCLAASPFYAESDCEPKDFIETAKQEASKFVANDTISITKTPVKTKAISAA